MHLSAYQEEWQKNFLQEKKILQSIFSSIPFEFHHIGSTSIVGAHAKPIVDILGVTSDVTAVDAFNPQLEALGYTLMGDYGMRQRRYFQKEDIHLHIFEDSDPETTRHLRFVAYLNSHPKLREEYSSLKHQLAAQFPGDRESYLLGKEKWIKKIDWLAALENTSPCVYPSLGPRKSQWTREQIVNAMHANLHLQMIYFAKYHPRIDLVFQPDATVVMAEIADDTFNTVHSVHFTEANVRRRVQQLIKIFLQKHLPFAWWVSELEDTPKNLPQILEECGLTKHEEETGMYLELANFHPHPPKEIFKRVEDDATLLDFTHVITSFSGHDAVYDKIYRALPSLLYQEGAPLEMYVLYKDGAPVSTGMVLMHAQVMGIYYVATRPAYRKMGMGTEMMHFLLARAKAKGYHVATLQASSQGKNLYHRLGFIECCWIREYKPSRG